MARLGRLNAARLAHLLDLADEHGHLLDLLALAESSERGRILLAQLRHVRRKSPERLSWSELARIMEQVETLAEAVDRFTHPRFMLDPPIAQLSDLLAAAEVRAEESGAPGRPGMEELAAKLREVLEADRRAAEGGDT